MRAYSCADDGIVRMSLMHSWLKRHFSMQASKGCCGSAATVLFQDLISCQSYFGRLTSLALLRVMSLLACTCSCPGAQCTAPFAQKGYCAYHRWTSEVFPAISLTRGQDASLDEHGDSHVAGPLRTMTVSYLKPTQANSRLLHVLHLALAGSINAVAQCAHEANGHGLNLQMCLRFALAMSSEHTFLCIRLSNQC